MIYRHRIYNNLLNLYSIFYPYSLFRSQCSVRLVCLGRSLIFPNLLPHFIGWPTDRSPHRNHIQSLDGDWGSLADSLRSLHLSGNSISEMNFAHDEQRTNTSGYGMAGGGGSIVSMQPPIKTFSKLRKLVWLDLGDNRISHISSNYLPRSLVTIDLSRNIFTEMPVNVLEHLHDLKVLSMRDNLIGHVANIRLANKLRLEKLDISSNAIETLPAYLFNGSVHVKAINFDKNFIRALPADAFRNLGTVHMVLAFNQIENISEAAFNGLENTLEYLDLEHNLLKDFPRALEPLNRLRYLYLTSNEISEMDTVPQTLRVLSLAANNFTNVPSASLQTCTDLSYLNIGYNKIAEIDENCFVDWGEQLQTLLLRNNKITRLNYGSFNGLESIKEISLSFNDIHYVYPNVFENISQTLKILELSFGIYRDDFPTEQFKCLTELMWLGLDNNNLKVISDESLTTLKELTYINLAFNRIMVLPRNIFIAEVHKSLAEVDLSYNTIVTIYTNTFDSLINLRIISLSSNRIVALERNSFYNMPQLAYVDLTHNLLQNISESVFTFLPGLIRLDLMFNNLRYMTLKMFKHVSNETMPLRLNVSHNRLEVLDGELSSFLYIYSLDARSNALTDVQGVKHLGYSLRRLYLSDNHLTLLNNHAFGDLELLEILDLAHNNLSQIRRRAFQGLNNLQRLDLGHNQIEQLQPDQFSNLRKLRVLNLAHNRLRSLPREIFLNTRIEYLDLSHNYLTIWPVTAFSDIGFTLRSIQISANSIEYLEPNMFLNTQFLYNLNISKNKLVVIPDNTFAYLNNLTQLDLSHNPLVTTNLKEIFHHTPSLRQLCMRAMGLYNMPSIPTSLVHLTELDVSQNYLVEISPLQRMRNLHVLKIAQNKVTNVSMLTDRLPSSLRFLDLSRNPIKKLAPQDFNRIRRLEELHMNGVELSGSSSNHHGESSSISSPNGDENTSALSSRTGTSSGLAFAKLKNLKSFHFDAQPHFGDVVEHLTTLHTLRIQANDAVFDNDILIKLQNHSKLNFIEITGRKLITIMPNAFIGLAHSHRLHIRIHHTQINDFPPTIFYALKAIPHLTIDVSNNRVTALAPDSFYPNASSWDAVGTRSIIGGLDTYNNPMQCECGLVWLGHWQRRWLRETSQVNTLSKDDFKSMLTVSFLL